MKAIDILDKYKIILQTAVILGLLGIAYFLYIFYTKLNIITCKEGESLSGNVCIYNDILNVDSGNIIFDDPILSGEFIGIDITGKNIDTVEQKTSYEKYLDFISGANVSELIQYPIKTHFDPNDSIGNNEKVKQIYSNYAKVYSFDNIHTGYIYIKASVNGGPLRQKDSIYLYLYNWGGHINKSESIKWKNNDTDTEVVFDLSNICFVNLPIRGYDDSKDMGCKNGKSNWLEILNNPNKKNYFFGFVSTSNIGRLESIKIYYK